MKWETSLLEEILKKYIRTRTDDRGRIYIPKKIRRKPKITEGDILYITLEGDKLKILTPSLIKEELKSKIPE